MSPLVRVEVSRERLRRYADDGELFAVVDACDRPEVPAMAWERGSRAASLFAGTEDAPLWALAPYLFEADEEMLDRLAGTQAWGVFVVADGGLDALAGHLRRLLVTRAASGEPVRFRFYDPRVLPAHLDGCGAEALRELFGPVRAFGVETEEGTILFRRADAMPKIRVVAER